jgi:small-conductance mechanosensitive channel
MVNTNSISVILANYLNMNEYLTAATILAVFFILSKLVLMIIERVVLKLTAKTKTTVDDEIVHATRKPASWLILIYGFDLFVVEIWKTYSWVKIIDNLLYSIMLIIFSVTMIKIINILITEFGRHLAEKNAAGELDQQLIKFLHSFVTIILYVMAFLWVISIWGVKIGPFLAGLGIGGIAIAFALQSTLANLFGGIALIFDKTLKVGDLVKLDGGEFGTVHEIGLRSTRIKTPTNEIVVVPNGKLMDSKITNFNLPDRTIRVDIEFGVAYGSDIDKVKEIALSCLNGDKNILKLPKADILFTAMADSSLNFKLMFWVNDNDNKWQAHQYVITKLYNSLNRHKIGIPFPQREIWLHNMKK